MDSPPPYMPPPQKKSKVGLIIGIIVGALAICCCLPLAFFGGLGFQAKDFAGCLITGEQARQAVLLYSKDHGGKLPDAAKWQDEIVPYASKVTARPKRAKSGFGDFDPAGVIPCDAKNNTTLAYNDALSAKPLDKIDDKDTRVLLFEVQQSGRNLHQPYTDRKGAGAPKLFMGIPRGWVELPVEGPGSLNTQQGKTPINSTVKARSSSGD